MRVVSGSARGRRLKAVPGDTTRPILDRVKTALFDILRPTLEGATVLDLFGGSGSVGIEALSQGASHCTFLDLSAAAVKTIRENLEATGFSEKSEVRNTDAFSYLRNTKKSFDLIYVAPPQYKNLWVQALQTIAEKPSLINSGGRIVAQIDPSEYEPLSLSAFVEYDQRKYGSTVLVFYRGREA
jgi:16S rRNA (guanine966-N2)-methyltransferase